MNRFLADFQEIRPKFEISQRDLLDWNVRAHMKSQMLADGEFNRIHKLFARLSCDPEKISSRGIHLQDAKENDFARMQIYNVTEKSPAGEPTSKRTEFFAKSCEEVFDQFYPQGASAPEHIVHVTCTGYVSPSGPQTLVAKRRWQTAVTHAYHMGCYAALPAIRIASALESDVDIVHTELCSLHLNPADQTPEQIVVQSLFADGFIKYVSTNTKPAQGFELIKIKEMIVPDSGNLMTWSTGDFGMHMSLSKDVPRAIASHIEAFLKSFDIVRDDCIFAIHPGGPRIIDSVQSLLGLTDRQVAHSKQILFRYGNMSSATLPHVWQSLLNDDQIAADKPVVSLAFGPGLTIFGALFRKL